MLCKSGVRDITKRGYALDRLRGEQAQEGQAQFEDIALVQAYTYSGVRPGDQSSS